MAEFSPQYYAGGNYQISFTIKGMGFGELPDDIVAVPMTTNDDPLRLRYNTNPEIVMTIREKTPFELKFATSGVSSHSKTSIGAILSQDREVVYWQNNTNPLP